MNIELLMKRAGIKAEAQEFATLKKDLENIVKLLSEIPNPTKEFAEEKFVKLHKDMPKSDSNKKDLLNTFNSVENEMIKI